MTENRQRVEQAPLLPLGPLSHVQHHSAARRVTPPWGIPKAPPLYITGPPKQKKKKKKKKKAQMKEQIKAPEIIQLSSEQIANLSDAQFKTLVIRKRTELVEFGHKLDEKMRAMLRETKENAQGTNSDGKETGN